METLNPVLSRIRVLRGFLSEHFLELAKLLSIVQQRKLYLEVYCQTMNDFFEREMQMSPRSGRYLIKVYEILIEELHVDPQEIARIGWTKASRIAPIVNAQNVQQWLADCERLTVREIERKIEADVTPEAREDAGVRSPVTFLLTPLQKAVVEKAVSRAEQMSGTEDRAGGLEAVAADFLSGSYVQELGLQPFIIFCAEEEKKFVQDTIDHVRRERSGTEGETLANICDYYMRNVHGARTRKRHVHETE